MLLNYENRYGKGRVWVFGQLSIQWLVTIHYEFMRQLTNKIMIEKRIQNTAWIDLRECPVA